MVEGSMSAEALSYWSDVRADSTGGRNQPSSRAGGRKQITSLLNNLRQRLRPRWHSSSAGKPVRQEPWHQPSAPPVYLMVPDATSSPCLGVSFEGLAVGDVQSGVRSQAPVQHGLQPPVTHQSITVGQPLPVQPPGNAVSLSWLSDFYSIDWTPKEYLVKFRQQGSRYRVGANIGFEAVEKGECGDPSSCISVLGYHARGFSTKLVVKQIGRDRKWKVIFEPQHSDIRLLTKKMALGRWLNLQVGLGHNFQEGVTGWKWKLSTSLGGSSVSQVQHKNIFPVVPGFDLRVGWSAEYSPPDIHGGLGTGEPILGMTIGHLHASLERVEAIFTNSC